MKEYRSINLIGFMYKIISNILALSLNKVIKKLVGLDQPAFIEGRSILDGPLIINKLYYWAKKVKK